MLKNECRFNYQKAIVKNALFQNFQVVFRWAKILS